jgi:integrase
VVTGYNARSRVLYIAGPDGSVPVSVDVFGPDERRLLLRETPQGPEPLWLWLGPDGMPKRAHGWQDTFQRANARVAAVWERSSPDGLDARERAAQCPLWARPHMLRHSFALKWYSILTLVWEHRIEGFSASEVKDLREQLGDVWYQMAALMGHRDPMTTRNVYLEPFARLEVDYLMSLLDGEESAGVDALVRAVTADSGRVLAAVGAGAAR